MDCTAPSLLADLAAIGSELLILLPDTATVARYTTTKDTYGGRTESWVADASPIMVEIQDSRPQQPSEVGMRLEDHGDSYSIRTLATVTLSVKDHVIVRGITYEVQGEMETDSFEAYHTYWSQIVVDA